MTPTSRSLDKGSSTFWRTAMRSDRSSTKRAAQYAQVLGGGITAARRRAMVSSMTDHRTWLDRTPAAHGAWPGSLLSGTQPNTSYAKYSTSDAWAPATGASRLFAGPSGAGGADS